MKVARLEGEPAGDLEDHGLGAAKLDHAVRGALAALARTVRWGFEEAVG